MTMTGEPTDRVQALFDGAADLSGTEREAYLDAACGADRALRAEVEELLAHDRRPTSDMGGRGFLQSPFLRSPGKTSPHGGPAVQPENKPPAVPGYEIEGVLGRGGMGVVYQARDLSLARTVALKLILAGGHAGEQERQRFKAEAEAVARLRHPNIVQIHAVSEHEGRPFCALEYVEGGSLARRLAAGPLPPAEAAALVETLAGAVHHAHQRGIVHRDLKPGNILATADGVPKITDFGLARRLDEDGRQTRTGAVLGTPSYMAPEQARADNVGPAADVYALGAILYECLTGRPPFNGSTMVETLDLVPTAAPVAPRLLNPNVPRDLETVCQACLRKEPARRYGSAEALAEDLGRWRAGKPITARPVGRLERAALWARRNPAVAGLLAAVAVSLLLGASAATYFGVRATHKADLAEQEKQRADDEARENKELAAKESAARLDAETKGKLAEEREKKAEFQATRAGNALHASLLRQAVRAWQDNDPLAAEAFLAEVEVPYWDTPETRLLRQVCRRQARALDGAVPPSIGLAVSRDGKRLALVKAKSDGPPREINVWDPETGRLESTFEGHKEIVRCMALSGDGTRGVSGGDGQVVKVWDAKTGREQLTFKGHLAPPHHTSVFAVAISGDGKRAVSAGRTVVRSDNQQRVVSERETVKVWDADTGRESASLTPDAGRVSCVAISADGRRVATGGLSDAGHVVKLWDAETGEEKFSLRGHGAAIKSVALSRDGRRVASGDEGGVVRVWDGEAGKELFVLRGHDRQVTLVSVSGDGTRVISGSRGNTIKVWDAGTGAELRTLRGLDEWGRLTVGDDGKRVFFLDPNGGVKVWDSDTRPDRLTLPPPGGGKRQTVKWVAATPDGRRVFTVCGDTGSDHRIRVWDGETGRESAEARGGHSGPIECVAVSADGKCVVSGSNDRTVKVWDGDTVSARWTLQGHKAPVCAVAVTRDGLRAFSGGFDRTVKVWDAATGKELRTLVGHPDRVQCLAVSGDGRWLVSGDAGGTIIIWNPETGERTATLPRDSQPVTCLAITPDGKWFVSGSTADLKLWDLETGQLKRALNKAATGVAVSADGKRVVSAGPGGLSFWDVETWLEKMTFPAHTGWVQSVALCDDAIVTSGGDLTAKVWGLR
jgi:WD40 repeat protein